MEARGDFQNKERIWTVNGVTDNKKRKGTGVGDEGHADICARADTSVPKLGTVCATMGQPKMEFGVKREILLYSKPRGRSRQNV